MSSKDDLHSCSALTPIGFGLDRDADIQTLQWYLQRIATAGVLTTLIPRMTDDERQQWGDTLTAALRKYLTDDEYHRLIVGMPEDMEC